MYFLILFSYVSGLEIIDVYIFYIKLLFVVVKVFFVDFLSPKFIVFSLIFIYSKEKK